MNNTCEKSPIFVGGGVVISYIGNDIPEEILDDIKALKNDLSEVKA